MREQMHGGDIYRNEHVIDFSVNSNPLGTPASVIRAVKESAEQIVHYPDTECGKVREAISRFEAVPEREIICGNGAAELFYAIVAAVMPRKALLVSPTFTEYERALRAFGSEIVYYELQRENEFLLDKGILGQITREMDLMFLCNPNNPTGQPVAKELVVQILKKCRMCGVLLVLDECFVDFLNEPWLYEAKEIRAEYQGLLIVKALTKLFAMPGLRFGYGISANRQLLNRIEGVLQPWNVSVPAQAGAVAALKDCEEYLEKTRTLVARERKYLVRAIKSLGYRVYGSRANYVFFRGEEGLYEKALEAGFLIRDCRNYPGLNTGYYRISVRERDENERMVAWLRKL